MIAPNVVLKAPSTYQVIGKPIARVDIPSKVDGSYQYVHNVRVPGMLHARMIHPLRLEQTVRSIDHSSLGDLRSAVRVIQSGAFVAVVAQREMMTAAKRLKVIWDGGPPLPPDDQLDAVLQVALGNDRTLVNSGDVSALTLASHASRDIPLAVSIARIDWSVVRCRRRAPRQCDDLEDGGKLLPAQYDCCVAEPSR